MNRFFADAADICCGEIRLSKEAAAHMRSLRLRPAELFVVCDGEGMDYVCHLGSKDGGTVAEIVEIMPTSGEPNVFCTAYLAFAKGDRLDYAVQKSVELGARAIVLFRSERCIAFPADIDKKTARYQRIALEAAQQCGRGRIPSVTAEASFKETAAQAAKAELPLFFYECETERRLRSALESRLDAATISIVTGPEGGFEDSEAELASSLGMLSVTLGPRILRCETAPIAALAAVMYHTENL